MTFTKMTAALLFAGLFSAGAALAQDARPMQVCKADADKLCASAERGGGRMRCLVENEAKLSGECKAVITKMQEARNAVREACKTDISSLCAAADADKEGRRAGMRCLRENQAKLSKGCADALAQMPAWRQGDGKDADTKKQ